MALSSLSPQGKLVVSIHQVTLHRRKPGALSVQNHLGKEPDAGPTLKLMLKVGFRGALEVEKEGTVTSVMRVTSSHFCLQVQGLQPPGQAPAEVAAYSWQLLGMIHLGKRPLPLLLLPLPPPLTQGVLKSLITLVSLAMSHSTVIKRLTNTQKFKQNPKLYFQSP